MVYARTTWVNGGAPAISATNLNNIEVEVLRNSRLLDTDAIRHIDEFSGANDNAKFDSFLSYVGAASRRPAGMFPAGGFGPLNGGKTCPSGLRLVAPPGNTGHKNLELSSMQFTNHHVQVNAGTGASSLFVNSTTIYDIIFDGVAFYFPSGGQLFQSTGNVYEAEFRDITLYGATHGWGSASQVFACTATHWTGQHVYAGIGGTQIHVGGSDCSFFMGGQLNLNGNTVTGGAGTPLMWFDNMQKASVGYTFITAENGWGGVRISASTGLQRAIKFFGGSFEGRSESNQATRPVIDMQGGVAAFYSPWIAYVDDAGATANGAIHQSGGVLQLYSPHYRRGTGVTATFPLLYQTGGTAQIYHPIAVREGEQIRVRWSSGTVETAPLPSNLLVA